MQFPPHSSAVLIRFIVATRHDETAFFARSLLVRSLEGMQPCVSFQVEPTFRSSAGMAAVYNPAIESAEVGDLLVFVHDDAYVDDWFLGQRLVEGLAVFDVIGVAGALSRRPGQTAWWGLERDGRMVVTERLTQSGAIKHVKSRGRKSIARWIESGFTHLAVGRRAWRRRWYASPGGAYRLRPVDSEGTGERGHRREVRHAGSGAGKLDSFGPTPAAVKMLDGVFLAARAACLKASAVRFDPRFRYHFYDLDFCRQCEAAGLRMGTWPIAISHGSHGTWDDAWRQSAADYLVKWGS